MTNDSTDYERLKSLYLRGHALPGVVPHIEFKIDLDGFRGEGNLMSLLGELKREITRIEQQVHRTGSAHGPTVAVYELAGSVLHIRAAVVDVPKPRVGGGLPKTPPGEPLAKPPTPPRQPPQIPLTDPPGPAPAPGIELNPGDGSGQFEGFTSEPLSPPGPRADDGQTTAQQQEPFEAAAWRARDILNMYKDGKLKHFEALKAEIDEGPHPEKIRGWLIDVKKEWKPWNTQRGVLDWEGLKPIDGHLPSKVTAVLDVQVYKIDPTNRTASLQLKHLYTKQHAEILAVFGTPRRPYIPVSIATSELADLLAFYRGIGLPVRLSLTAQFSLVQTKKPEFIVTLTCPVETSPEVIKAAVDAKLALVLKRPKQLGLWDQSAVS
jgi:hypothetical protein